MLGGGKKISVGIAAPSLLCPPLPGGKKEQVLFLNNGTVPVYIGDGQVTSAYGYPCEPLGTLILPGDSTWYGIADAAAGATPQVINVIPEAIAATASATQIALQIASLQLPVKVVGVPASASDVIATITYNQGTDGAFKYYPAADVSAYQSVGVIVADPGGLPATGHCRIALFWQSSTGQFVAGDTFFKTAGLISEHAVPVKAPQLYFRVDGNVGSATTVYIVGYSRAIPVTEPLQTGVIFAGTVGPIAAGNVSSILLPGCDAYGPASVWAVAVGLESPATGYAIMLVNDYDHIDALVFPAAYFVMLPGNVGVLPVTPTWLSRYRHKIQFTNHSSVALTFNYYVIPQG